MFTTTGIAKGDGGQAGRLGSVVEPTCTDRRCRLAGIAVTPGGRAPARHSGTKGEERNHLEEQQVLAPDFVPGNCAGSRVRFAYPRSSQNVPVTW